MNVTQIQVSSFVPTNITQNWISWNSSRPFQITFFPSSILNGTVYFRSTAPLSLEVNGVPAKNGTTFSKVNNITLISGPGPVNVTALYLIHDHVSSYVIGTLPINTSYHVEVKQILGGEELVVSSPVDLNMTVIPLNGLGYKLDGLPFKGPIAKLTPGRHVVEIIYPGEVFLLLGLYLTSLSFAIALISEKVKEGLITIRGFINRVLDKIEN
ncbi:hypothetical protein L3N51_02262 [Metallosphaera sp. J1]|uniref:hypothetical protein n=1 Tax=Metallosphaera javensis (ex Hofmann et al. 2022) TaxID=99938 RepID=UPI001EE07B3A|nr:hypothetical protein [Metallosphaera javensis (ex Hofmann et al. 2022)]MCG3109965.1 hypothetical protein [Metallosphaera javensis (ex Hofmann et al. 2022)]